MRSRMLRASDGPGGPRDARRPGPARRPAAEQPAGLKEDPVAGPRAHGLGSGLWTGKVAAGRALSKYKVGHVPRTMQELLRDTGPGRARPGPRHPGPPPGKGGRRLKKAARPATCYHSRGRRILAGGEAPRMPGWNLQRGRYHEDAPAVAPVTLSRRRLHSIGAPGDGAPYRRFYDKANTENYADFLKGVHDEHGRFAILLDNAPCHKSKELERSPKETDGKIRMYCFPPHAPEPSPAGVQWKSLGKAAGNRLCEGVGEMQESINAMLRGWKRFRL